MFNAIIKKDKRSLNMPLPLNRNQATELLAYNGITDSMTKIRCIAEENAMLKVKICGESEFENKLASFISSDDSLSYINTMLEIYQALPYQNKLNLMESVMSGEISSVHEFVDRMINERMQDITSYYYCPLSVTVYNRNSYGNFETEPEEYDGSYLTDYEDKIRELIIHEDELDSHNIAEYFSGSNSAVAKLKEVHFSTQNVSGILYGKIRAELTAPFSSEEESEFKDWLVGQCSDGYGEGLEQRPIVIENGELYVSYWHYGDNYFMLNEEEFNEHLTSQNMGEIE